MKKVYYLSTCETCQRIMSQVKEIDNYDQIDIKTNPIDTADLDKMAEQEGGYEKVFSKRARKYRSEGWNEKELSEADYKKLILTEYTFLKRPVFMIDEDIFVGNSKKNVAAMLEVANG